VADEVNVRNDRDGKTGIDDDERSDNRPRDRPPVEGIPSRTEQ